MSEEAPPVAGPPSNLVTGVVKAIRPRQWVKNLLVLAAPVAALGRDVRFDTHAIVDVLIAFVTFSLAASCIYLINDARDVEADRAHPTKRNRPIAEGVVPVTLAYGLAVVQATMPQLSVVSSGPTLEPADGASASITFTARSDTYAFPTADVRGQPLRGLRK